jgi:hypothetical protein
MKKKNKEKKGIPILRIFITVSAIIVAGIHLFWPAITIDAITITLLVIAIIPWLQPFIKSFELPGGLKIEYQDVQKISQKAERSGLLNPEPKGSGGGISPYYAFQRKNEDPVLIFSSLLLDLENQLRSLLDAYPGSGGYHENDNIYNLLISLKLHNVLTASEVDTLKDVINILYSGIHGAKIDESIITWATDVVPTIISSLVDKMSIPKM